MRFDIFDQYNIRARLSVYVIILSPLVITLYAAFDIFRELGASVIFIVIAAAFSNYFFIVQRFFMKSDPSENYASTLLYHENTVLKTTTKNRYYEKLASIEDTFKPLKNETDNDLFKKTCTEAIVWLRNNARNNHLVQEENTLYGFINNALNAKPIGIALVAVSCLVQIGLVCKDVISFVPDVLPIKILFLLIVDVIILFFWIFGINKKLKEFIARKYAIALLGTIDTLPTNKNN